MSKPTILAVDDDPQVLAAITRDLSSQYGGEYRVVNVGSGAQALSVLTRIALRDEPVALILADQRMPQMTGIDLLEQARMHAPTAKLLLLTAYADTEVAIKSINEIGLDYYLMSRGIPRPSGSIQCSTTCSRTGGGPTGTTPPRCALSATVGRTVPTS